MKKTYNGVAVPPDGKAIEFADGVFHVPDHPIIPFIEGDGTGRDIWKASRRVFDAAVEQAYGGKRKIAWFEVFRRRKSLQPIQGMAAAGYRRRHPRFPHRHQRPAHHSRGRRHSLAQRHAAPGSRPLRLRAPGALFPRRSLARDASRAHERRDLPRKYRRRLRRHRMELRHAGSEKADRISEQRNAQRRHEKDPRGFRRRHQADVAHRHQAPRAPRHPIHALENKRNVVTLVHKGNIQKFTEGAFRDWGYELATAGIPPAHRHRARKLDPRQHRQEPQSHRRAKRRDDRARPRTSHRSISESRLRRSEAELSIPSMPPTATASGRRKS